MRKSEIIFTPAWNKESEDPSQNYGISGVDIRFYLIDKEARQAVQFVLYTNWYLPDDMLRIEKRLFEEIKSGEMDKFCEWWTGKKGGPFFGLKVMPADLGYHSPVPMYEGQEKMDFKCDVIDGDCYYDGSTLNAERIFDILVEKGSEGVWAELEKYFDDTFGGEKDE